MASVHDNLNWSNPAMNFTVQHEKHNQLPFLDTLVTWQNDQIKIDVYRKPTHTNQYLDFNSHHPKTHKQSTKNILIHRATTLPTTEGVTNGINYVTNALTSNGYPKRLIQEAIKKSENSTMVTPEPEELVGMFFKMVEPREKTTSYAVLPYIKGLTENITRTLRTHDIQVTNNYSLPRNSDHLLKSKQMFTKYLALTATGAILGKPGDRS